MRETIFPPAPMTFDESPKSRIYDPKAVDAAARALNTAPHPYDQSSIFRNERGL